MTAQPVQQIDFAIALFQALLASIPLWLGVAEYIGKNLSAISERPLVQTLIAILFVVAYGVLLIAIGVIVEFLVQNAEISGAIAGSIYLIELFLLLTGAIILFIFRLSIGNFDTIINTPLGKFNIGRLLSELIVGFYIIVVAIFLWSINIIQYSFQRAVILGFVSFVVYYVISFIYWISTTPIQESNEPGYD